MEYHSYTIFLTELREDGIKIGDYISIPHWELLETFNTLKTAREWQRDYQRRFNLKTIILPTY